MLRAIEWILLGIGNVAAVVAGVRRYRPARVGPWLLLAAAVAGLAIGDVFFALGEFAAADVCYLVMFALVALSMLRLTRGGAVLVDRTGLLDLLAFSCAALLVVWVFVIGDSRIGQVSAADVIGDVLLIGVAARLIVAAGCNWSAILLAVGAVGMLVGDIAYPLSPSWITESPYVVLYLAWGAAALHPSMARLTEPQPARTAPWQGRRAALLGLSVATPPTVLLIEAMTGTVDDGVVIAVAGGLTLMMVITRLADSVAQAGQAEARERSLRMASAALVAAADRGAVDEAVRAAIGTLMPPNAVTHIVFADDDRRRLPGPDVLSSDVLPSGPLSGGSVGPPSASAGVLPPTTAGAGSARSWWFDDTARLPAAEGQRLRRVWARVGRPRPARSGEATLVCPLWLEPLEVARPSGGVLAVTGRRAQLAAARDSLEVLAGQAALALDRIDLVEAVGRRDSDLYLRAVIRNTAEVMLVIDDDQRVRYASPALSSLVGRTELPALGTLGDLVHPDDRVQVRQALQNHGDGTLFCALMRPDDTQVLVEATYRDLRQDRLVQGYVVTLRPITSSSSDPVEQMPHLTHVEDMPAWVNRRSAQHKFRY